MLRDHGIDNDSFENLLEDAVIMLQPVQYWDFGVVTRNHPVGRSSPDVGLRSDYCCPRYPEAKIVGAVVVSPISESELR